MACAASYFKPAHQLIHAFRGALELFMLIGEASL